MKLLPLRNFMLVRQEDVETKTASGLFIPDTVKEKPLIGEVIATGPGNDKIDLTSFVGSKVLYKKWGGTEVKVDGEDFLLIEYEDILAIVDDRKEENGS